MTTLETLKVLQAREEILRQNQHPKNRLPMWQLLQDAIEAGKNDPQALTVASSVASGLEAGSFS